MRQVPGAILDPGLLWSGSGGWSTCDMDVWHYTVGRNSIALCRDNGLVQTLTRDEGIYQFVADIGMRAWTQCEWNDRATANEVESIDGSVSTAQLALMAYREQYVISVTGIPWDYFDAVSDGMPRMPIGTPYRGVTTHRSLIHRACDMHSDGFDRSVWDAINAGPAPPPEEKETRMLPGLWQDERGAVYVYDPNANTKTWVRDERTLHSIIDLWTFIRAIGGPAGDPSVTDNATTHLILATAVLLGPDPWA